ncbi:hypothetical protein LMIY3S_03376 [Labrys miyagiensis]
MGRIRRAAAPQRQEKGQERSFDCRSSRKKNMPLRFVPNSWGRKVDSRLGAMSLTQAEAGEINISPIDNYYSLLLLTPQPRRVTSIASSRKEEFSAPAGTLEIIPPNVDYFAQWNVAKANIILGAPRKKIEILAEHEFNKTKIELRPPHPGRRDEVANQIGQLLISAITVRDEFSDLFVDSVENIYWIHLIRTYSSIPNVLETPPVSLPPYIWNRVIEYMHANLANRVTLQELASISSLSQSHFRRAFQKIAGMPPHQYLLKLRIEAAERLLVETNLPLALIAQMSGFASQSHVTRAMKQWRGITPGHIRKLRP